MRLTAEIALHGVARALRERIAPALDDAFAKEALRLAEQVVSIMANGMDKAVAIRADENARIRAVFATAGTLILPDRDLARRLEEAAVSVDPGLRISELDAENGRLRHLLVDLHRAVEDHPGEAARVIDQKIWRLLSDSEAARAPRS